jgi:RNA polymerase sigma-70 factor (ECF subfamily)
MSNSRDPANPSRPGGPDIRTAIIEALRSGDRECQGKVLRHYEPWLRLLARYQMETRFRRKFDPSDVVQQALLEALKSFPRFRGRTEAELVAWLRRILAHVMAHEVRRFQDARKRAAAREVSLEASLAATSQRLRNVLAASGSSPSVHAAKREEEVLLAEALERLPADYREVIFLRNIEGLPHEEVAKHMRRSPGAVRMLWVRALAQLKRELGA